MFHIIVTLLVLRCFKLYFHTLFQTSISAQQRNILQQLQQQYQLMQQHQQQQKLLLQSQVILLLWIECRVIVVNTFRFFCQINMLWKPRILFYKF